MEAHCQNTGAGLALERTLQQDAQQLTYCQILLEAKFDHRPNPCYNLIKPLTITYGGERAYNSFLPYT